MNHTQIYYHNNDYSKPIHLINETDSAVTVRSSYWNDDRGILHNGVITFQRLGPCEIKEDCIKFSDTNIWHKDTRKNILFIGANAMDEIYGYVNRYNNGIFIEAIPVTYERLKYNLTFAKPYNTNYIPVNELVTSKKGKEYTFSVFNNGEASSSIYEPNMDKWQWPDVRVREQIKLISTTIEDILREHQWENIKYDVVLDVQGAELEVLNGVGENNLKNIESLKVEISTEEFYKGGVLFNDLNDFLVNHNFVLTEKPCSNHCDVIYTKV